MLIYKVLFPLHLYRIYFKVDHIRWNHVSKLSEEVVGRECQLHLHKENIRFKYWLKSLNIYK